MMIDRPTKQRISLVHTLDYKERMEDSHVNRQLCDCVETIHTEGTREPGLYWKKRKIRRNDYHR